MTAVAKEIEFVVHDVLQLNARTTCQQNVISVAGSLEELFIANMRPFEGYPVVLCVLSEGLGQRRWVEYIKRNPEWQIELHGVSHSRYDEMDYCTVMRELSAARKDIETVFAGTKITTFYPPFNKISPTLEKAVFDLGLELGTGYRRTSHYKRNWRKCVRMDFHYWNDADMRRAHAMLYSRTYREPIIIVGAPRSGTTALMRMVAACVNGEAIKENESIWKKKTPLWRYYSEKLAVSGKSVIVDKNVRNSFRLAEIYKCYPGARVVHIVRDGRAAAHSWRDWAIKTGKADQTLEGAIQQWKEYVEAAAEGAKLFSNFTQVSYEELCRYNTGFRNQNNKRLVQLTKEDRAMMKRVAGGTLRRFGYR